jgi:hypothetical protein
VVNLPRILTTCQPNGNRILIGRGVEVRGWPVRI